MNQKTEFNLQPGSEPQHPEKQGISQSTVIPVIEEQVRIGKQVVETGIVRIAKKVHEEEVAVDANLLQEEVEVEKVPVNQYVETAPPPVRYEGDVMIIPVLQEVVVKRLLLVEEIRVTKRKIQTQVSQPVTLRREEITVERDTRGNANPNPL